MDFRMRSLAVLALALGLGLNADGAQASVVITGTRVVYPEAEREVTVKLNNEGASPALVQTWLDEGDPNTPPNQSKAPFTVVPPLFRLDPKKGQGLRLVYTRSPLPKDKESLFWLNVLEVPPKDSSAGPDGSFNKLQLAIRTRIKVFFRPIGLSGSADEAAAQVSWRFVSKKDGGYELEAINPTPYHVSFSRVDASAGGVRWSNEKGGMAVPGGSVTFDMGEIRTMPSAPLTVEYSFINDYGARVKGMSGSKPAP